MRPWICCTACHEPMGQQDGHLPGRPQSGSPSSSCRGPGRRGGCPAACAGACMQARTHPHTAARRRYDICCLTRHPVSEETNEPHMMEGVLQSSALNRKLRVATCQCSLAAGIPEGPSYREDNPAISTSPRGTFKDMILQLSWRQRVDEWRPLTWRRSPGSVCARGAPGRRPPGRCPRRPPCPSPARPAAPAHPAPRRPAHTCFVQTGMLKGTWRRQLTHQERFCQRRI